MEKNIILIHSGLGILLVLYLIVRLLITLFGLSDKDYLERVRKKFRRSDWFIAILIGVSGLYPILSLGQIELYHIIKLVVLGLFVWISRYAQNLNFAKATVMVIPLVIYGIFASFSDQPKFPRKAGAFVQNYPEAAELSFEEKGALIFTTICVQCHGPDGSTGRFGAADLSISKYSVEEKIEMITNGSALTVMRSFANELSEDEIRAVATYVNGLKK